MDRSQTPLVGMHATQDLCGITVVTDDAPTNEQCKRAGKREDELKQARDLILCLLIVTTDHLIGGVHSCAPSAPALFSFSIAKNYELHCLERHVDRT